MRDAGTILDAHYLNRDPALAESASESSKRGTRSPDRAPDWPVLAAKAEKRRNIKWLGDEDSNLD